MAVKQKLSFLIITLVAFVGVFTVISPASKNTAYAASCGGVQTSIISCGQTGSCPGGENPFEGDKPKNKDAKDTSATDAYEKQYGHPYGKCDGGVQPADASDVANTGIWGVLLLAINILTAGVGIAAIGGVIYGSVLYTTAGGSQEQVKKAMGIITNVVIGVIAYALMFAGLNFLIPGGIFAQPSSILTVTELHYFIHEGILVR